MPGVTLHSSTPECTCVAWRGRGQTNKRGAEERRAQRREKRIIHEDLLLDERN
jgi:hypothetical protein